MSVTAMTKTKKTNCSDKCKGKGDNKCPAICKCRRANEPCGASCGCGADCQNSNKEKWNPAPEQPPPPYVVLKEGMAMAHVGKSSGEQNPGLLLEVVEEFTSVKDCPCCSTTFAAFVELQKKKTKPKPNKAVHAAAHVADLQTDSLG